MERRIVHRFLESVDDPSLLKSIKQYLKRFPVRKEVRKFISRYSFDDNLNLQRYISIMKEKKIEVILWVAKTGRGHT